MLSIGAALGLVDAAHRRLNVAQAQPVAAWFLFPETAACLGIVEERAHALHPITDHMLAEIDDTTDLLGVECHPQVLAASGITWEGGFDHSRLSYGLLWH